MGLGVIWGGYHFYKIGWTYLYGFSVPKIAGILLVLIGVFHLTITLKNRNKKSANDYLICGKCLETYLRTTLKSDVCPKCSNKLEELHGFYERNPELKSIRKT